jgi:hypothetical protein
MNPQEKTDLATDMTGFLLKGDLQKVYYLMILSGYPPAKAIQFLFNLKNSDSRASMITIRNQLIGTLKNVFRKLTSDQILYTRARALANAKDFNVFEEVQKLLPHLLEHEKIEIAEKFRGLNSHKKRISEFIINMAEEMQGTAGTQLGQVQGSGTSGTNAGIDSFDPLLGGRKQKMIRRQGKMLGNPYFKLQTEGYSLAINGKLPQEINEALNETGVVVLENEETEQMMFLVSEALDPVGQEDDDIDNDGDSDGTDSYLKNRRRKRSDIIKHKKNH